MPSQEGPHYRFKNMEFWAERGMISLVDTEAAARGEEQYHWRVPPGEFIKRAIGARMQEPDNYPDRVRALRQMLDDAKTACKMAKAQGDPTDPSVLDHVIKHRRRTSTLVMPHELPPMPGVTPKYKVTAKGQTPADTLRDGVQVTPDLTIGPGDFRVPRRKRSRRRK